MKHRFGILPLISAFYLTFASCDEKYTTLDGSMWATSYHIVYSGAPLSVDSIEARMLLVDNQLSMFNPSSALSVINAGGVDTVNQYFRTVFDCASYVSSISGGRYDPTVAPLVDLWGFGRTTDAASLPSDSAIAAALQVVGISQCSIDSAGTLHRRASETQFDFSSLAKGYGVDLVADYFDSLGVKSYMVEIGGEIRVKGYNPRGRKWHIQVDQPIAGTEHRPFTVLELGPETMAVATSGNYRNFRLDSTGRPYGHTISPVTGRPVETEVLSATVVAPSCVLADALATACMTGSASMASDLIDKTGLSALIICADDSANFTAKKIGRLPTPENP